VRIERGYEAKAIGRRLAAAREAARLSQVQAGQRLGVPQSVIARLELGLRQLRFVEGLRLAELYEISPSRLAPDRPIEPKGRGDGDRLG
jgi:transcriptional regulator with XRE-family HTH domain